MKHFEEMTAQALLEELGRRVAQARVSVGLRQEELASRAGISRNGVSRLENGAGGIRLEAFLAVLRALHKLDAMSLVLPEVSLTPLELAALETKKSKTIAKRVRRAASRTKPRWGDEV